MLVFVYSSQELPQDIGEALCDLLDVKGDVDGMRTRYFSCTLNGLLFYKNAVHEPF